MEIKEYDNSQTFLEDYEAALLDREAASQFILYHAYQCSKNNKAIPGQNLFGAVLDAGKAVLLYSNQASQDLIIYAVKSDNILPAVDELADKLGNSHIVISGIRGRNDVCTNFIEQYKKYINNTFIEKLGTDIMEIRNVNDIKAAEGNQRLALPEEAKRVTDWMIEFQLEALANEMDYEAVVKKAAKYIEDQKVYLFVNSENQIVSMAIAEKKLVHGIVLNYVYTPEEHRGEGYAAANVYYLSKNLLEQGNEFCTMLVDKKNPLSSRAYEKVGYVILEDNYEYKAIPTEVSTK